MRLKSIFVVIALITFLVSVLFSSFIGRHTVWAQALPEASPALPDGSTPTPTDEGSWIRLPDLPADATQADVGAEIYRLVCQDCHGDKGQGLTQDWIATWDESDQNCWQAKCHASNHPPEGFVLPRYVPAIVGSTALARFETSSDLYAYMVQNMPFHNPGSLLEEEYWQLAAFIVRENELPLLTDRLDHEGVINLHTQVAATAVAPLPTNVPSAPVVSPTPVPPAKNHPTANAWPFDGWIWLFVVVLLVAGAIFSVTYFMRR